MSETNEAKEMEKVTLAKYIITKRIDDMSDDKDNSDPGYIKSKKVFIAD